MWQFPTPPIGPLPPSAEVYRCLPGTVGRNNGDRVDLDFEVVNTASPTDDDLTFRADAIGEIRLSDGTLLTFPAPIARTDGITDTGNHYSNDALRARVVGFDLFKTQVGNCTEDNTPLPPLPDDRVQIGEECRVRIEAGNWFGFDTPGFDYIGVQNINVEDTPPDGQGFLRNEPSTPPSTAAISGVTFDGPTPNPLGEDPFDWTFNTLVSERIETLDEWFRQEVEARILNDPQDTSAAPNVHAALSRNVLTSTFDAIFFNPLANGGVGAEETFGYSPTTIGFPAEIHRRFDLTVVEPFITVTQEVCNETLYGGGPSCTNFVALADDGDAFDTYLYRVTVANEASAAGEARAPAYDVTVTTDLDPSDLMFIDPLTGDTLDNDGDSLVDGADGAGEGSINDNVTENGTPAQFVIDETHSDALLRIDAGDSVVFYYRVDPDDDVAPLQTLAASSVATYDSLEGATGNQTAPIGSNGDLEGARRYTSAPGDATIQIIPVQVDPKAILRTSNTALATPQNVSIGEEVEFEIRAQIPVAKLRTFTVRDELPVGMSCAHAPDVNLDAPPYDAAGFVPGGIFTPTCTDSLVLWEFGDQTLTMTPGGSTRFDFPVDFIARVDNAATNNEATDLVNGGIATVTNVSYIDDVGVTQTLDIPAATVTVREPVLELTKAFSVADVDAGDLPRVTVTITNSGTATAYNPRILEDLSAVKLTYQGDIQGATPPTDDVVTFGSDRPLFTWAAGFGIAPAATVSFSFAVSVDGDAEPLEDLENTIQADWTSLPSQNTALNPSGAIGPNGDATGMRNGALPNAGDTLNDYEAEVSESVPVRAVLLAKTDLDTALDPEIGTHKQFEVLITLPEGTTRNVVLTDDLDAGAVSYVLADTATFRHHVPVRRHRYDRGRHPGRGRLRGGAVRWRLGNRDLGHRHRGHAVRGRPRRLRHHADDPHPLLRAGQQRPRHRHRRHAPERGSGRVPARRDRARRGGLGRHRRDRRHRAGTHGDQGAQQRHCRQGRRRSARVRRHAPVRAHHPEWRQRHGLRRQHRGHTAARAHAPGPGGLHAHCGHRRDSGRGLRVGAGRRPFGSARLGPGQYGRQPRSARWQHPECHLPGGGDNGRARRRHGRQRDLRRLDLARRHQRLRAHRQRLPHDHRAGRLLLRSGRGLRHPASDSAAGPAGQGAHPDHRGHRRGVSSTASPFHPRPTPSTSSTSRSRTTSSAPAADLRLLSVAKVSGSGAWTPVNTGTPTAPVIEDTTIGIDIPAGEQVVLDLTVVLQNNPAVNTVGLPFTNTANFTYNWIDGDPASVRPGQAGTSAAMTIVGPDFEVTKTGPASMTLGVPGAFTVNAQNIGTGTAWNTTLIDELPDGATGGTCDVAPTVNSVQVFEARRNDPGFGTARRRDRLRPHLPGRPGLRASSSPCSRPPPPSGRPSG